MSVKIRKQLIILFTLLFPLRIFASVVINEIAWMGTSASYNDEWIELYNSSNSSINLDGWTLKAADGTPEITLSSTIQANGFYILERTDDSTLPNIEADQIYTGSLGNKGEHLQLFDAEHNLVDEVDNTEEWLAGDNATKQTMERVDPSSSLWQTSKNPLGTPKTTNSVIANEEISPEPESAPEQKEEKVIYPSNIIISEILPSPEGPDSENEFIEIFNKNDFDVDLEGWEITDTVGSVKTYTFPKGTAIKGGDYLVLYRPETSIVLNNDADDLKLLQPDATVVDGVSYEKAPRAQSYNQTGAGWLWSQKPSPASKNIIKQEKGKPEPSAEERRETIEIEELLDENKEFTASAMGSGLKTTSGFTKLLSIAVVIAVFSSAAIFNLKKLLNKEKIDF